MFSVIRACVFDAYGTLFDVHSAVAAHRERLGPQADAISASWRGKQLEYTWLRSLMKKHTDFWQVTADALDFALERHNVDPGQARHSGLHNALMQAYLQLSPYPEVQSMLASLRREGMQLAILSNGSPPMLDAAINNADMQAFFDAVLSVESVATYKPSPVVYQLAVEQLGVNREHIVFLSSNAWDVAGAATFGFRVIWVNRFNQPHERLPGKPEAMVNDLASLPSLLGVNR